MFTIIKYVLIISMSYMVFAGLFTINITSEEFGIGLNFANLTERVVSDFSNLAEISK